MTEKQPEALRLADLAERNPFGGVMLSVELRRQHAEIEQLKAELEALRAKHHVGDSNFESWFGEYSGAGKGTKQQMRDAYAAGMGDAAIAQAVQS